MSQLVWRGAEFKAQVIRDLMANGALVGKFVETDAARRLREYPELDTRVDGVPFKGGGAYRAYVASLMGSDVVQDGNSVLILVGVRPGRGGRHHGLYIELGSRTAPARPFLRPAVFENAGRIVALLEGK